MTSIALYSLGGLSVALAIGMVLLALRIASLRKDVGHTRELLLATTIERDKARLETRNFVDRVGRLESVVADKEQRLEKARKLLIERGGSAGDLWDVVKGKN